MENNLSAVLPVSFLTICFAAMAVAETLVLQPGPSGKEAYVCECKPNVTNPGGETHKVYQGEWRYRDFPKCYPRALIKWDIDSLPKNIKITKAVMELRCCDAGGDKSGQLEFSRLIENWSEESVTHATCPNHTTEDSVITGWPIVGQWHAVDVTEFVQLWYAARDSNHGLICRSIDTTGTYWVGYYTSDHDVAAHRPKLTITYSLP